MAPRPVSNPELVGMATFPSSKRETPPGQGESSLSGYLRGYREDFSEDSDPWQGAQVPRPSAASGQHASKEVYCGSDKGSGLYSHDRDETAPLSAQARCLTADEKAEQYQAELETLNMELLDQMERMQDHVDILRSENERHCKEKAKLAQTTKVLENRLQQVEETQHETAQRRLEQEREMVQRMQDMQSQNERLVASLSNPSFRTSTRTSGQAATPNFGVSGIVPDTALRS